MNYKSILFLSLLLSFGTVVIAQQEITGSIEHDNLTRDYVVYLPSAYTPGARLPLVFNFHGFGSNALEQRLYSGMSNTAETEGFIVCYPNGVDNAWNVDWTFGSTEDDLGFTAALIETLVSEYDIDRSRVYACGMSNGGFFSYQLACHMSDQIAAVASVTGSFSPNMLNNCSPSRKVPVMEIHGTNDFTVAYDGTFGVSVAVEDVIDFWVAHNTCVDNPIIEDLPDTNMNDDCTITRFSYQDCEDESEVFLLRVNDGGHTWPGTIITFPANNTNQDISASQEIWDFFNRHQVESLSSTETEEKLLSLEVFPNPTDGLLKLRTEINELRYRIYDIKGQLIITKQLNQSQIDLSGLNTGVYLLEVTNGSHSAVKRIVKN